MNIEVFIIKIYIMRNRLTERDLSRLIKRVINEHSNRTIIKEFITPSPDYVVEQCYNLIKQSIIEDLDNIVDTSKEILRLKGGKFPQGSPPTEDDWNEAQKKILSYNLK